MPQDFLQKQCVGFLNTPPLWVNDQFGISQFTFPEIDFSHFRVQPLTKKLRLGHQMEQIFKQLIDSCPSHDILLHNLPVKREKQTLGEIDFIIKDTRTQKTIHVELTYKFYIIDLDISEPIHRLVGPNRRDMFFTKMEKIKNEQFQLLHTPEGKDALTGYHITTDHLLHKACYKAQLFSPYGTANPAIRPLNTACICGYWLRFNDFNSPTFKSYHYYIPYKSEWVIAPHEAVQWSSHFEVLMDLNIRMLKESAPMVWVKKSEAVFEKLFVVWW